ncbi:adenosine deaminase [Legionella birminghamensis]|uniref:Adenosine deaminase n=1 Tax=Legionella birminghamensis TaxID=28083 RepID=A0A378I7I4_9GAMM|nr:adenosine deaminase [Legionella birminghamensis]KTC76035.1 adenosine deaminase [Legionella birminghamensis]STX30802.1 adenosine deaminase [Legionella birminghamensis]
MTTIKQAELHVHLEGTISPELALKLAKRNKINLPSNLFAADGQSYQYKDFLDFLKAYDSVASVIKNPLDYYDITFDYLKSRAEAGGIYVEMMYSPDHAEMSSGIPSSEHLAAIQQAIDDAEAKYQIVGRIIVTAVRHFGEESAIKVARQAIKENVACVTGFGLGGDEIHFPPKLFAKAYQIAADGGLQCTVHAGEFASAEGMMEAMDYLPIKRIGHGVRAIESAETMARLKDSNIALEVCPGSNVALGLFKDLQSHPLPQLLAAGIRISLNSDDPPFFRTHLANEYMQAQKIYGFSEQQMLNFTRMALEDAFVDETTRARLLQRLQ